MATSTTLDVVTRHDRDYRQSVTASDAGSVAEGTVQVIYDDDENQEDVVLALQKAIAYITANVSERKPVGS